MQPIIYADLRCLQDPKYQFHPIGYHLASLLRARKGNVLSDWKTIGLVDRRFPRIPDEYCSLVDQISLSLNPCCNDAPGLFIDASPMTHDTRFGLRFHGYSAFLCAAIVHDLKRLESSEGLPELASRIEYLAKLARLRASDLFFPISEYTAGQLCELLSISPRRIIVTGSAVPAPIYERSDESAVGQRFWSAIGAVVENRRHAAVIARPHTPRLAFLSPYPPDKSDAAFYTAMTMQAGKSLFRSDLYTDTARPLASDRGFRDAGPVSIAAFVIGQYNGIISVLAESARHTRIFEVFQKYGGPCILHDFEFTPSGPEYPFLEQITERASPLIVNTVTQQYFLKKAYGADAQVVTCCPRFLFTEEELTTPAKEAARNRQGITPKTFLVSSFGYMAQPKALEAIVLAIELLRSWNIPAELCFFGSTGSEKEEVDRIATLYGTGMYVHSFADFTDVVSYRDFLIASDAAIQLGVNAQPLTALTDCISAGLPCVATDELASACDAPEYVSRVPDRFSVLQVGECLAGIWEATAARNANADARAAYLDTHNFEHYAKRLLEILGFA